MASRVLSIEIGQQTTKVCEVDYQKKNPHVYNCISFDTPNGVIDDGYIHDKIAFATVLREQLTLANIKNDRVIFTVSSTKIANREAVIPYVKENMIGDIVEANAGDYFPVNIADFNITYSVLERVNTKQEKQIKLLVLAAPSILINSYYELAEIMKFNVVAIDYVGNSTYQLLKNQINVGVNLVVQMNDQNAIVNLLEGDQLLIQRTLPFGTINIADAVISNNIFGVSNYSEAMNLLHREQIINFQFHVSEEGYDTFVNASDEYNQRLMRENAKEDVTASIQTLLSNLSRVIDYFTTKHPGKRIGSIHLAGEGVQIRGLEELIRNEMGIEVYSLTKLYNVTFNRISVEVQEAQSTYISCIGAAIAPIDFTPKNMVVTNKAPTGLRFPCIILGICFVGAIAIFLTSYLSYKSTVNEKKDCETKISQISDIEGIYQKFMSSKNEAANMQALDLMTKKSSEQFLLFLAELEEKTPNVSIITNMSLKNSELTLMIESNSKTVCAKYIETLKTFESLNTVTTSGYLETVEANNVAKVTYTVVCTFK